MDKKDKRLNDILAAIQKIATGDFSLRLPVSEHKDELDGIATGINMLSEEVHARLNDQTKEKDKLQETIAELNDARDKLKASEELFRTVFHTSPDIITISKLTDGVFIEVNRSFTEITGYTKEELIGISAFDIGMWNDPGAREKLVAALMEKGSFQNMEASFRIKSGKNRMGLVSASLININGETHLLTVSRDITEIKEAEAALRSTKEQYEDLIKLAPNGIIVLNKAGIITMINPAYLRISGYSEEDLLNKHFTKNTGFRKKDVPKFIKIFAEIIRGKIPDSIEVEWIHKNGKIGYAEVNIAPLHKEGRISGIQAIITDTTERVKAIEALRSSENRYRSSMDSMIDSVFVINQDEEIILANKSLVTGLERMGLPGDVVGKKIRDAFPFLAPTVSESYKKIFKKGNTIRKEEKYNVGPVSSYIDIRMIPIYENKQITRVLTIVQDITERKKAENVQQIMYNISNAVDHTKNLNELFLVIQHELGNIFDTTNFFIALYNQEDDTLSLPFFVDEKDSFEVFPAKKSLTGYVIRNDMPLLIKDKEIEKLVKAGEVEDVGTPSKIWLGVPLKIREEIIGALVMQHYKDENAYVDQDLEILKFVSTQISFSIQTKRAYDEIQVEKAHFEQLFQVSPETIVVTDKEGKLLRVNNEFEKLFGYSADEVIGKYVDKLIVPQGYEEEARNLTRTLAKGKNIGLETVRKHKDGHLINISLLGTPIKIGSGQEAVYGIYRDITDRRKAENELETSRKQYRMITELSSDFAYTYQVNADGSLQIEWVGGALKELTGFSLEEIKKSGGWETLIYPDDMVQTYDQLSTLMRNNTSVMEYRMITKSGRIIWVSDNSKPVWSDVEKRVVSIYGAIKDITEKKQFEESLKIAKDKAEQSDRLKTAFLANMSHEIRTPMNAILGFSELIGNEELSSEDRGEYLKIIKNKGNELLLIINDIVDISKIEAGDITIVMKDTNLNTFISEIYSQSEEEKIMLSKEHIQIRTSVPDDIELIVHTDQIRLGQVLNNLVCNALKFTLEGYVEIGFRIIKESHAELFVRDTGIGISADKQDIIFDRFRQVNESVSSEFGGTGLGLAISKNLIELLGGDIRVKSSPGQGSTFYFRLPVKEIRKKDVITEIKQPVTERQLIRPDLSTKSILIAEDDSSNYLFLESYLRKAGAKIIWAKDGIQVMEIFESGELIDLVFMDIRMPNMNGIDATRLIRESNQTLPVIALTAYAFANDRDMAIKAGCNAYLSKPVKLEQLSDVLSNYLS